jgi:hypothetical protein
MMHYRRLRSTRDEFDVQLANPACTSLGRDHSDYRLGVELAARQGSDEQGDLHPPVALAPFGVAPCTIPLISSGPSG